MPADGEVTAEQQRAAAMARIAAATGDGGGGGGPPRPGEKQRANLTAHANAKSPEKLAARNRHRKTHLSKVLEDPELMRGGLLAEMLNKDADVPNSPAVKDLESWTPGREIFSG